MITLKYCQLTARDFSVDTVFSAGGSCSNWVPHDDESYRRVAEQCGHSDPLTYCREHDYCHALLAEMMFDKPSAVLWAAAHNRDTEAADWEEKLVYYFQRFLHYRAPAPEQQWGIWRQIALRDLKDFPSSQPGET